MLLSLTFALQNPSTLAVDTEDRKSFFQRIRGKDGSEAEMSFVDHLEALRWHIIRAVLFVLVAAIVFFVFIDFLFDRVIMGPTRNDFISPIYAGKSGAL